MLEDVPAEDRRTAANPYSLSPGAYPQLAPSSDTCSVNSSVEGGKQPPRRLLYSLTAPGLRKIVGGLWVMRDVNTWLVQRTFGLLELRAREGELGWHFSSYSAINQ